MINYSFSPNWYRPQCLVFSRVQNKLYYSSNCIIYEYDFSTRRIISQLNIKHYLIKQQGYNCFDNIRHQQKSIHSNNSHNGSHNNNKQKDRSSVDDRNKQKQKQKQKVVKISAIQLHQTQTRAFLFVGFNCLGLFIVCSIDKKEDNNRIKVTKVHDIGKSIKNFSNTQFMYILEQKDSVNQQKKQKQIQSYKHSPIKHLLNQVNIVLFSSQGLKTIVSQTLTQPQSHQKQSLLQKDAYKLNIIQSYMIINNRNERNQKGFQVKLMSRLRIGEQRRNSIDRYQDKIYHIAFLSSEFNSKTQKSQKFNILILNDKCQKVIKTLNINSITQFNPQITKQVPEDNLKKLNNQRSSIYSQNINKYKVLSVDQIQLSNIKLQQQSKKSITKYIVLLKRQQQKPKIFCQQLQITSFTSQLLQQHINNINKDKQNEQSEDKNLQSENKEYRNNKALKILLQIIYPKKCHYKLSQQQKSAISIKFINQSILLLTGRLGEMMFINLKQIQQKNINQQKNNNFKLSIKPYSFQEEQNPYWVIEPNQKHYKDVYGIYRIDKINQKLSISQKPVHQSYFYLIGTDHILTTWKLTDSKNNKFSSDIINYQSNIKFLTSSVQQIIVSQLQPSLLFFRLADSNIRSCQPFSHHGYWLNQFWKHTTNSFSKEIQKLVLHTTEIGVAAMTTKQGKIILYDLYEQRLMKVIEIKQKIKQKTPLNNEKQQRNQKEENKQVKQAKQVKKTHTNTKPSQQNTKSPQPTTKALQINSISFEHQSIQHSINSLYSLQKQVQIISQNFIQQTFNLSCQSFYQRQMNNSIVIMLQTNDYIILLSDLNSVKKYPKLKVFKKMFKLQRIYKTKYWNNQTLIGTKKRKGNLLVSICHLICNQNQQQFISNLKSTISNQNNPNCQIKRNYQSIQTQVKLSLGSSCRYMFKLSVLKYQQNKESLLLTIISYKGTKFTISLYKMQLNQQNKWQLNCIFDSQQIQLSNHSQNSNSAIVIEHMVISQEENEYLIGVYNNQMQTISVIDYKNIISESMKACQQKNDCQESIEKNQKKQYKQIKQQQMEQNTLKRQSPVEVQNKEIKLSDKKDNIVQNNKITANIFLSQYSQLTYRVESMIFNKMVSNKTIGHNLHKKEVQIQQKQKHYQKFTKNTQQNTYLIIIGKDQSIRLLQLQQQYSQQAQKVQKVQKTSLYKLQQSIIHLKNKSPEKELINLNV